MTIVHNQVAGPGDLTSASLDTSGMKLLVMNWAWGSPYTPTDSKSNTWHALTLRNATTPSQQFFYAWNPNVGTGHTFGGTGGLFGVCEVIGWDGALTSGDPFDQQNGGGGINQPDPTTPGSITPGQDGELCIVGFAGDPGTATAVAGYTITDSVSLVGGNNYAAAMAYLVQTTAAPTNPSMSGYGATNAIDFAIASFKAAPASPPLSTTPRLNAKWLHFWGGRK